MNLGNMLHAFAHDSKLHVALILVCLDFILGNIAAVKLGNWRGSYVADVLRNDVLFKLVPWAVLYCAALVAGNESVLGPLDVGDIAGAAYATAVTAWVFSIVGSVRELGLYNGTTQTFDTALANENNSPPKD